MKLITQKNINNVIDRLAANFIIAADALSKADLTVPQFKDAADHLVENAQSIAKSVGGMKGLMRLDMIIEEYYERKEQWKR